MAKSKSAAKYVYFFGGGTAEGSAALKPILGGKGANLAEMCGRGFDVPSGFTITTDVCNYFMIMTRSILLFSTSRLMKPSRRWKKNPARSLVMLRTLCW